MGTQQILTGQHLRVLSGWRSTVLEVLENLRVHLPSPATPAPVLITFIRIAKSQARPFEPGVNSSNLCQARRQVSWTILSAALESFSRHHALPWRLSDWAT
jgi:hypothetical protein